MKTLILISLIATATLLQGCRYPDPAVTEQKDERPKIGVSGAPEGALLYVDGLEMGPALSYDGEEGVLLVESGKHLIELRAAGGKVLYAEEVFLSSSTTKIIKYTPRYS